MRFLSLILLLYVQGSVALFNISCVKNICAVMGTSVTLKCFFSKTYCKTGFWFSEKQSENWRKKEEPEDLMLDSDYAGRVSQLITNSQSELTITDLRETDSGEYQLMFIMKDGVKHLGSVNLTVTVLRVKMNHKSTSQDNRVELTCDTSCYFSPEKYSWIKNGQFLKHDTQVFVPSDRSTDSYSCFISKYFYNPSSSLCVSNSSCWNVIYPSRSVCALVGSTVDIPSTYSHPTGYTVEETFWHLKNKQSVRHWDLREEQQFAGRVEYVGNTLRIKDVNISDSGEYRFRIISNTPDGKYSGLPGVILTVTDAMVTSSPDPVVEGEKVILSCSTQCTLDIKHTYIWYKNGQQVTDGFTLLNKLYLDSVSSEEIQQYSCAVGEPVGSSALGQYTVTLLVFLPQMLIIAAVWMWFFLFKKRSAPSKDQVDR